MLAASAGKSNVEIACEIDLTEKVVGKWRHRKFEDGFDGLQDGSRPGRPAKYTAAEMGHLLSIVARS